MIKKKTKIIATVGPACNTKEKLWELVQSGVNVFRLNFSHGSHEVHASVIKAIREINQEHGANVSILQDLQGPKIRTDEVENNGVDLVPGAQIVIQRDKIIGTKERISTSYQNLTSDVKPGDSILIDDGNIELKVIKTGNGEVTCEVVYGGLLKSRKGINLPNTEVSEPSLTDKDKIDLIFGIEHDVDWIALSFVRRAEDLLEIKSQIRKAGKEIKVVAKIEKPEAVRNIDAIIRETDAIMVARGDLGVELPMEDVPMIQKMIVRKCNEQGKPVIVATQMMESMIQNPRPTRAEANDVANAIVDGTDAVMLSAETASGNFPALTVTSMARICAAIEAKADIYDKTTVRDDESLSDELIATACELSKRAKCKAILGISLTGGSAFRIAAHRPSSEIFIATDNKKILTQLNLLWGVRAVYFDAFGHTDDTIEAFKNKLVKEGYLKKADRYVATASMPMAAAQHANSMKLGIVD